MQSYIVQSYICSSKLYSSKIYTSKLYSSKLYTISENYNIGLWNSRTIMEKVQDRVMELHDTTWYASLMVMEFHNHKGKIKDRVMEFHDNTGKNAR